MYRTQTESENSGVLHSKQNQTKTRKPHLKRVRALEYAAASSPADPPLSTKGGEFLQGLFV